MTERPPKKDVANALLGRGSLFLHLDPRFDGVVVPQWLAKQPQLVLQVGLDMAVPIPDLSIDDEGVFATLSFNRSGFPCTIPWAAVFALVGDDGMGVVWPEDMPAEIASEVERATRAPTPKRGPLRSIEGGKSTAEPTEPVVAEPVVGESVVTESVVTESVVGEPVERAKRPHLRLVK